MNIVAIIEARMTSRRLPGKHLLPAAGRPMIANLIRRLQRTPSLTGIVLATTVNETDEPLARIAAEYGVSCFRGSEPNVMERVLGAAESAKADLIVGITGDCPLIDPDLVEQAIRVFRANKYAYLNNAETLSYPDGMNTQVYHIDTLRKSFSMTQDPLVQEHVTLHIRRNPDLFPPLYLVAPPSLHWPELALTLDERADYELLKRIIEHFGEANPYFSCREILEVLRAHPEWVALNQAVKRKGDE